MNQIQPFPYYNPFPTSCTSLSSDLCQVLNISNSLLWFVSLLSPPPFLSPFYPLLPPNLTSVFFTSLSSYLSSLVLFFSSSKSLAFLLCRPPFFSIKHLTPVYISLFWGVVSHFPFFPYVSLLSPPPFLPPFYTLKMYIGGFQNHPYSLYVRLGDSPTRGKVSDINMKDIRNSVKAVRRAAPRYVTVWLWNGWVVLHSLCSCIVRHFRVCKGGGGVVTYLRLKNSYLVLVMRTLDMYVAFPHTQDTLQSYWHMYTHIISSQFVYLPDGRGGTKLTVCWNISIAM